MALIAQAQSMVVSHSEITMNKSGEGVGPRLRKSGMATKIVRIDAETVLGQ